jgi:hypothetical protein
MINTLHNERVIKEIEDIKKKIIYLENKINENNNN